jgi:glycosidase
MDYIADMGASCLWLTPIFVSETHHGYDSTDLTRVEPRLGGDDALRAVVAEAKTHGIRVLLDFVCNHVSDQHPLFQDALSNPASPYRNWFTFDNSKNGYRTYFGVPTMPEVNLGNPEARRWMIDTARHWMREFQVDGYRLDHANGPGPDFWTDFWAACKEENPDSLCFGEVVDAPSAQVTYVGRLDGCLDFHLGDALRRTFALKIWTEAELDRFLARHRAFFPGSFLMPTFIDNHDMDRFLYLSGGDKEAVRRAARVQMGMHAPPIIYYGTEVGLNQSLGMRDGHGMHVNRVPMVWDERQDRELLSFYRELIQKRKTLRMDADSLY